jgi:hypothetical protein
MAISPFFSPDEIEHTWSVSIVRTDGRFLDTFSMFAYPQISIDTDLVYNTCKTAETGESLLEQIGWDGLPTSSLTSSSSWGPSFGRLLIFWTTSLNSSSVTDMADLVKLSLLTCVWALQIIIMHMGYVMKNSFQLMELVMVSWIGSYNIHENVINMALNWKPNTETKAVLADEGTKES